MKTILLVDNVPDDLLSLRNTLSQGLFSILTARSAAAAMTVLREYTIDLMISEFKMPDADGLDFISTVKRLYPFMPMILISQYFELDSYIRTLGVGVADYLRKPIHPRSLLDAVNSALNGPWTGSRGT